MIKQPVESNTVRNDKQISEIEDGEGRLEDQSVFLTFIRRSLKASKPASVHIAVISDPENSSLVITNSSKLTSSANVILDMWICNQ